MQGLCAWGPGPKITLGELSILDGHEKFVYGSDIQNFQCRASIVVRRDTFWTRIALGRDLGFAEAYIHGDCTGYIFLSPVIY